jgi:Zn-dependent peptidase ImmA (M78 family)
MKLNLFLSLYNITKWPINCAAIFKIMNDRQLIRFTYGFAKLPNKFDAITEHKAEHNLYITLINRNKVNYPFQRSRDRRLDFTLAHEIGHIILEHLLIAPQLKTEEEKELEEIEANEFAGKLLMPEKLIYNCNFYSIDAVAEYFNV